ncbi:MAG TPA: hypothetical protein VMW00_06370 [Dehalococcoidales bacterium]|nr:hypothetical protein [Dehalococcoidales bacterium]
MANLFDIIKDFQASFKLGPMEITIDKQSTDDEGELTPEVRKRLLQKRKDQLEEDLRQVDEELEGS